MKQLLDFIPLIIFFALYKLYDIYAATAALIIASALQLLITYAIYKKVEKIQLITGVMVALFGMESHHCLCGICPRFNHQPPDRQIRNQNHAWSRAPLTRPCMGYH